VGANFADEGVTVGAIAVLSHPANIGERAPWYVIDDPTMRFVDPAILAPAVRRLAAGEQWDLRYRIVIRREAWTAASLRAAVDGWRD
jgi:hypothetical protein